MPHLRVRNKRNISHIPEGQVNDMDICQLVRFSDAYKLIVLSSTTFHMYMMTCKYVCKASVGVTRENIGW